MNAASLAAVLEEDALKLYTLIWARTMACQLEQAILSQVCSPLLHKNMAICVEKRGLMMSLFRFVCIRE